MTVAELIAALEAFPPNLPAIVEVDGRPLEIEGVHLVDSGRSFLESTGIRGAVVLLD